MSKRKIRIVWALAWAVFFCPCVVAYSQTEGSSGGNAVEVDPALSGKELHTPQKGAGVGDEKAGRKAGGDEKKAGKRAEASEPVGSEAEKLSGSGGLLELTDGEFLYRRIPDKKFPEVYSQTVDAFISDASITPEENLDMSQRKGLFGLSARATDYLAKGFLAFIILMIVILYRLRSKSRRSAVHKSFR